MQSGRIIVHTHTHAQAANVIVMMMKLPVKLSYHTIGTMAKRTFCKLQMVMIKQLVTIFQLSTWMIIIQ